MEIAKDFFTGFKLIFTGILTLLKEKYLWKYAIIPIIIIWVLYISTAYFTIFYIVPSIDNYLINIINLPESLLWLQSVITCVTYIASFLTMIILFLVTISSFYELFSCFIFDYLVAAFENKRYGNERIELNNIDNLKFILSSIFFGIKTIIIFTVLFSLSIFFPIIGQILIILILGYRFGVSVLITSAFYNNINIKSLRIMCSKKFGLILGFGVCSYILILIPFFTILLLPALTISGSIILNEKIK